MSCWGLPYSVSKDRPSTSWLHNPLGQMPLKATATVRCGYLISIFGLVHFWELKSPPPLHRWLKANSLVGYVAQWLGICLVLGQILVLTPLPQNKGKYCSVLGCPFLYHLHFANQQKPCSDAVCSHTSQLRHNHLAPPRTKETRQ